MHWQEPWPTTPNLMLCPFLGRTKDRDSVCGYATGENACYAPVKARTHARVIPFQIQTAYCLQHYSKCRRYYDALARLDRRRNGSGLAQVVGNLSRRALRVMSVIVGVL